MQTPVAPTPASPAASPSPPPEGERLPLALWRAAAGVLISLIFLVIALRGQDIGRVREALSEVNYGWVPPALALYFAGVWLRAVRWTILLRPLTTVRAHQVLPAVIVGYTANNLLPLRTGELVRAYLLSRRHGVRKTATLATIAVERLFDGLTMLSFMLAATTVVSFTAELRHLAVVALLLFTGALIGLVVLTLGGNVRDRLLQLVLGPMPASVADRVERLAESFLAGLGVLRRKTDLALVAGTSLLAWLFEASMYWTIARGFGAELTDVVGIGTALLTTGVANLATLVPSSPGYVGTFEAGVVWVLAGALDVRRELALSYAIVVHAALWFPITLIGAFEWWRQHVSLAQARQVETSPPVLLAEASESDADPFRHRLPDRLPVPATVSTISAERDAVSRG